MAVIATKLYVATDGNANNSGSSRTVQASGSGAVTDGATGVVDLSADTPDLSGIDPADGVTIRILGQTAGYRGTDVFFVSAVNDGADTVTVDPVPDAGTGQTWVIGGEVPSLDMAMQIVRKDWAGDGWNVTDIWMKHGTYTSTNGSDVHATIYVSGLATSGVRVAGYKTDPGDAVDHWGDDDYRAIIDGDAESLNSGIGLASASHYYTFSNITVRRCEYNGIEPSTSTYVNYENCKGELNGGSGLRMARYSHAVACEGANNTGYGIEVPTRSRVTGGSYHDNADVDGQIYVTSSSSTILFAEVYGIPENGTGIGRGAIDCGIFCCTVDGEEVNGTYGIRLYETVEKSTGMVANSIIVNCGTGIKADGESAMQVSFNNLLHNNTVDYDGWREGVRSVETAPKFVDAVNHDYRLDSDSPAVAAGYPASVDIGALQRLPWSAGSSVNLGMQDMRLFQKSENVAARRDLFIQMVDETDNVTPKTGLTLAVQIGKAGGSSYADIAGSSSEVGNGTYKISLAAADLDTEGESMLKVTATSAAPQYVPIRVVCFLDEVHLAKAALVNARAHTIDTGVDVIKDDDGETTLRTLTPSESEGVVTVTPS